MFAETFPKSSMYDVGWVADGCYGANPLWLAEWLCDDLRLQPGMRILDLGCGLGRSSVFLAKEYEVDVTAVDLWNTATQIDRVARDAGVQTRVRAMQLDVRDLPFPDESFDMIIAIDSYQYFGTDALFLPYILRFLKPQGKIAFASAGLTNAFIDSVPSHLSEFWQPDAWCLNTSDWWRHHWQRTKLVSIEIADTMKEGWQYWLAWSERNGASKWYLDTLNNDAGRYLGYVRMIATRRPGQPLLPYSLRTGS